MPKNRRKGLPSEKDPPSERLTPVRLSDVTPRAVAYLSKPYVPIGCLTLLEGDPAAGKSYAAADLGAAITQGKAQETEQGAEDNGSTQRSRRKGAVVIHATMEDSAEELRERYATQGADLTKVLAVTEPVSISRLRPLVKLIEQNKPKLLVIDPIHALLDKVSLTSANAVRNALAPLVVLATRHQFAILAIRHLAKSGGWRAIYRGLGSIDFSAVARSVIRIGEDPARPGSRVLVHVKNSYGPLGHSLEFEIVDNQLHWLGRSELRAIDLDTKPKLERGRGAGEIAEEFIREILAEGEKPAAEVRATAMQRGINERTLSVVQKRIGVKHRREGVKGERGKGKWFWRLPGQRAGRGEGEQE